VTYQDSYHRVVVGIVYVVGELFYDLKEVSYESVVNVYCKGEESASVEGVLPY
jgi:hypothetical protein